MPSCTASPQRARLQNMWRVALVVLMSCSQRADPPHDAPRRVVEPRPEIPDVPPPQPQPQTNTKRMHSTWTGVHVTEESCWYFSGPDGRDTKLSGDVVFSRDGEHVTMTWGNATFTGTYRDNVLDLERTTKHQFEGTWTTKERFHGDYVGGKVKAHYHYEECEAGAACPNECSIEGELALSAT
jgi:hypothetical protein